MRIRTVIQRDCQGVPSPKIHCVLYSICTSWYGVGIKNLLACNRVDAQKILLLLYGLMELIGQSGGPWSSLRTASHNSQTYHPDVYQRRSCESLLVLPQKIYGSHPWPERLVTWDDREAISVVISSQVGRENKVGLKPRQGNCRALFRIGISRFSFFYPTGHCWYF
jgi:hypothetical protein